MTSQDNQQFLTVDMFNTKMDTFMATLQLENEKLRSEINNTRTELKGEIQVLRTEIKATNERIDATNIRVSDVQTSITVYFTIATVFIALIGIVTSTLIAFAPRIWAFLENRKQTKAVTLEQVQEIVDRAIAKAFSSISK